jgi:hypothetical protein
MGLWNDVAGVADHLAGSTDEAVARQFDNTPGGGASDVVAQQWWGLFDWAAGDVDDTIRSTADVSNVTRWGILLVVGVGAGYAASRYTGGSA